MFVARRYRCST